jgi:hypothetical protein
VTTGFPMLPDPVQTLKLWANQLANMAGYIRKLSTFSLRDGDSNQTWIENEKIYRKVLYLEALPNTTTKTIAHLLSSYQKIVRLYGVAKNEATGKTIPLPHINADLVEFVELSIDANLVQVISTADYSAYDGYIVLEYIKD